LWIDDERKEFIMKTNGSRQSLGGVAAALLAGAFSLHAHAAGTDLPTMHHANGVAYVSGGIGADEAQHFKAEFNHYPLVVEVFRRVGARDDYTADATVRIVDHQGRAVLNERTEGPFMLVRLPAGDYRVSAALDDGRHEAERHIHVDERGHAKAVFVFDQHTG
jgi:hypothetical protein